MRKPRHLQHLAYALTAVVAAWTVAWLAAAQDGHEPAPDVADSGGAAPGAAPAVEPSLDTSCARCHGGSYRAELRQPVVDLPSSVHGEEEIDCTGCHGGDPRVSNIRAHDPAYGFRAAPRHGEVVELCGSCHEEHGEVVQAYLGSRHSTSAATGGRGATCFACHGAHGIRAVDDPASAVHRDHVSETCGTCHADAAYMAGGELPNDQLRQYRVSVHGRAVSNGNADAPTCAGCHDPHAGEAGLAALAACAGCHEGPKAAFDSGPHASAFASRGFLGCVECHGSHEVRRADFTLVASAASSSCRRCHAPGQAVFPDVQKLAELVTRADDAMDASGVGDEPASEDTAVGRARIAVASAVHAIDVPALEGAVATLIEVLPEPSPEAPAERPFPLAQPAADSQAAGCAAAGDPGDRAAALLFAVLVVSGGVRRRRAGGAS